MISLSRAHIDRRIPISRVRSDTETSMIFIIPIPHTMRDIAAIPARNTLRVFVTLVIVESISALFRILKFIFDSSVILNFFMNTSVIAVFTPLILSESVAVMAN